MQAKQSETKKTVFSGIQPSGTLTLGNYIGAVRNWRDMQNEFDCVYCIVDSHTITVRQDPAELHKNTLEAFALVMACGITPDKSVLFIQSHNHHHAELAWVLSCYTQFGELSRMTQFKDKSARHQENVNAGLFTYPALMAADILLYQAHYVPVGSDQKQHIELARDVATRMNSLYGELFVLPQEYTPKLGERVMSLLNPEQKMSKSDENSGAYISLLDPAELIVKKFKRAVTDSGAEVAYRADKPGISNLMTIYSVATGRDYSTIEAEFAGRGYGDFKTAVGEAVAEMLRPIRESFTAYMADPAELERIYRAGALSAAELSGVTLERVLSSLGFVR